MSAEAQPGRPEFDEAFALEGSNVLGDEWTPAWDRTIDLWTSAIGAGLSPADELVARHWLGNRLLRRSWLRQELTGVLDGGLESAPDVRNGVEAIEQALRLDAAQAEFRFKDDIQRNSLLNLVGFAWQAQARYTKKRVGAAAARTYLEARLALLQYLGGSYLPALCLDIGVAYAEEGNGTEAERWFLRAIDARVPPPPPDPDPTYEMLFVDTKRHAASNLQVAVSSAPSKGCLGAALLAITTLSALSLVTVLFIC